MKVLIVDDEQLVRWFLERALKKWGHDVISAASAKEAQGHINSDSFDVMFTDLRMPEESGTMLLDSIDKGLMDKMKIVVCSAFITPELAQEFKEKGIMTLRKPFKLAELESTINSCSIN